MMDAARTALHLDVACPRCGAGFSDPCRTATGKHAHQVHAQRADLSAGGRFAPEPCLCTMLGLPCECRKRGRPQTQPHGTVAAARRHYRHGERPCEPCRQAERRHWQDYGLPASRARRERLAAGVAQATEVRRAA
jgi:hypothetical protein